MGLLFERSNGSCGLELGPANDAEPELALVGLFRHDSQLRHEDRARITPARRPIVGGDRSTRVNQLPGDSASRDRIWQRLAEFHDRNSEILSPRLQPLGCF